VPVASGALRVLPPRMSRYARDFPGLGRLWPTCASRIRHTWPTSTCSPRTPTNDQLGNPGDTVTAYRDHLRQFVDVVRPALISYDHYQFSTQGDNDSTF